MTGNALEVRNLSVSYVTPRGRVKALRHIDLEVPEGKIVGLVGESGCGKSTLLAAIIGLLDANAEIEAGVIEFEGRDLLTLPPRQFRALRGDRISMIFQDPPRPRRRPTSSLSTSAGARSGSTTSTA